MTNVYTNSVPGTVDWPAQTRVEDSSSSFLFNKWIIRSWKDCDYFVQIPKFAGQRLFKNWKTQNETDYSYLYGLRKNWLLEYIIVSLSCLT